MIDLSTNLSPLGPTKSLLKLIRANVLAISKYSYRSNSGVIAQLSKFLRVPAKSIALGVGSTQIFMDIPKLIHYKRAVVIAPTFWEYTVFNTMSKKRVEKIILMEKRDFEPDYDDVQKTIKSGDCVFICNVNNPTSRLYSKQELVKLVRSNPKVQFVIDETYLLFRGDFKKQSLVTIASKSKNLHVVMSFSKFFSIAGLRLGVIVSNSAIAREYNDKFHIPYSLNPITGIVLNHIIEESDYVETVRRFHDAERDRFYVALKKVFPDTLNVIKPEGNFIFLHILTGQTSVEISKKLKKLGIKVRSGSDLIDVDDSWIRVAVGSRKNNNIFIKELRKILK